MSRARDLWEAAVRPRLVAAVDGFSLAEEHAFLVRWFEPVAGPVVDAACGGGDHGRLVAQPLGAHRVVGVDLDPAAVQRARAHRANPGIRYLVGDITALPFADAELGGALCFGGLSLVDDPRAALAELARCVADGGPLVGLVPRATGPGWQRKVTRLVGHKAIADGDLRAFLLTAGWRPLELRSRGWTTLFAARRRR